MSGEARLSTAQVAARLGAARETVNGYAAALEALRGVSLKGAGGARGFSEADLALLRRARARLRETPGVPFEVALRWALETPQSDDAPNDAEPNLEAITALRAERAALEALRGDLRALAADLRDLPPLRARLEATVDDIGTELQAMGATVASWSVRLERIEASLRALERVEREGQARVQRLVDALKDFETRALERAVGVWLLCGIAAFLLGFVVLPWLARLLGGR